MASHLDRFCGLPLPRQQLIESIGGVSVDHSLEHVAQIGIGLDAVQLAGLDQRAEGRPARAATIAAGEEMVLAPKRDGADCALHRVGIELDASVVQEACQGAPARKRVTYRFGERAVVRHAQQLGLQPGVHIVDNWLGLRTSHRQPMARRLTADLLLDRVKLADTAQGLCRQGRAGRLLDFVKLASRMRPTCGKNDVTVRGQLLEAGIAIDVQKALEVFEVSRRPFGFAIGREHVDRRRRCRSSPTALIASVDPETPSLRSSSAGVEYRHRRVIGKEMIGGEHVFAQPLVQCVEPPACATDPSGQRRAVELNAVTRKDLRLPVQRRVVTIFADQHLREQRRGRQAACDWALRRRCLTHRSACATAIFGAANADDAELCRYPVQHLADALPDRMQGATAACTGRRSDVGPNLLTWQMTGKWLAPRLPVLWFAGGLLRSFGGRFVALDILQAKRELVDIDTLGSTSELCALQLANDQAKTLDLTVIMLDNRHHIANEMMQHRDIGRQTIEIDSHAQMLICAHYPHRPWFWNRCYANASTCDRRTPHALGRSPIDTLDQHRELRWCKRDRAAGLAHPRPNEAALIEPLAEQAQAVSIPKQDLQDARPLAAEGKEMAA